MKLIYSVMPVLFSVIYLNVIILLAYAILGVELFCGNVRAKNTGGANFDGLWESFQTCFLLMMGEGTGVIMFEAIYNSDATKAKVDWFKGGAMWFYFTSFQILSVWIISNLFVGIVLEALTQKRRIFIRSRAATDQGAGGGFGQSTFQLGDIGHAPMHVERTTSYAAGEQNQSITASARQVSPISHPHLYLSSPPLCLSPLLPCRLALLSPRAVGAEHV
jgi:hypothetical protein